MKTVKEMSNITGVSVRTLHYYDEIGLLSPTFVGENGYRFYDDDKIRRLQEILLFKELKFPLKTIKTIMDSPSYDRNQALTDQINWLELKKQHLEAVIAQAKAMQGGLQMTDFTAYTQAELTAFQKEAKERWGRTAAYEAFERHHQISDGSRFQEEMTQIILEFGQLRGLDPGNEKVQQQVNVLQDYITTNHYPCNLEILASLGQMYVSDERFTQMIDGTGGLGTAKMMSQAIARYCSAKS